MEVKKPYVIMLISNIVSTFFLVLFDPFHVFLFRKQFHPSWKGSTSRSDNSMPMLETYNAILLIWAVVQFVNNVVRYIRWPLTTFWEKYETLGLIIFNSSLLFKNMIVCLPILWNFFVYHTPLKKFIPNDYARYEEICINNCSVILNGFSLFLLAFCLPWIISHVLPMMLLYFPITLAYIGCFCLYLHYRHKRLNTQKEYQTFCSRFLDEHFVLGKGPWKFFFMCFLTIIVQQLFNYGVLFYANRKYGMALVTDFGHRGIKEWWERVQSDPHWKAEFALMIL